MKEHMLSVYPEEGCGVVINKQFISCTNIAEDKEQDFQISKEEYFVYNTKSKYGVQAVIHSHTKQHKFDLRTPSMADMQGQKSTDVPWGIVATEGENVSETLWYGLKVPVPIANRIYIHNVYDCLTLAVDYLKLEFDITVPVFPRPLEWDDYNKFMITDGIDEGGFIRLDKQTPYSELQHGDFILFKIQSNYVNHVGVVTEKGDFWHQLQGRYSKRDNIGKWHKQIVQFLRHKELI